MDQDANWYGARRHCVRWRFSSPGHSPQFLAHVYCGQMVAHLSYCWARVAILDSTSIWKMVLLYNKDKSSAVAEMDDRGHNRHGPKSMLRWCVVSSNKSSAVAEMGDHLATIDMCRRVGRGCCGGCVPTGSPSNTVWPGPRPTSLPSGILIHQTIWPQL